MAIHTHADAARRGIPLDLAGLGLEILFRVFGIDAALDRVTVQPDVSLKQLDALPRRNADLRLDQVNAADHFGDRMLDLDPRVHFHEVEALRCGIENALDRAGASIVHVLAQADRRLADLRAQRHALNTGDGLSSTSF